MLLWAWASLQRRSWALLDAGQPSHHHCSMADSEGKRNLKSGVLHPLSWTLQVASTLVSPNFWGVLPLNPPTGQCQEFSWLQWRAGKHRAPSSKTSLGCTKDTPLFSQVCCQFRPGLDFHLSFLLLPTKSFEALLFGVQMMLGGEPGKIRK
jgi:hypothetical protein